MKSLLLIAMCSTFLSAGVVLAEEHHHDATTQPAAAPTTQASAVNTMCLVETDHPVDDRETIVYKGQTIGFCCEDCMAAFKKNPEKYIEQLNQQKQDK